MHLKIYLEAFRFLDWKESIIKVIILYTNFKFN